MTESNTAQDLESWAEDYEALTGFEEEDEQQEMGKVIRGLEALWAKAPLPADFREVIESTPDNTTYSKIESR